MIKVFKISILTLLISPFFISCEKDSLPNDNELSYDVKMGKPIDLKEMPEPNPGGGGDPESGDGFTNIPDNPNDYDPNPDGTGDVDNPGLHPSNDESPSGDPDRPEDGPDGFTPQPEHDFTHADDVSDETN